MEKLIDRIVQCNRCSHTWLRWASIKEPKACPGCKSRYWNQPRIRNVQGILDGSANKNMVDRRTTGKRAGTKGSDDSNVAIRRKRSEVREGRTVGNVRSGGRGAMATGPEGRSRKGKA